MIREDNRGARVAIVADFLINPDAPFYSGIAGRAGPVLDVLMEDGWGIMKTPPHVLPAAVGAAAVATVAGDAVDYLNNGYAVVVLAAEGLPQGGVWREPLQTAFADLQTAMPDVVTLPLGDAPDASTIRATLAPASARAKQTAGEV
jgi:hypothetical protein